jgi:hypothetical protein
MKRPPFEHLYELYSRNAGEARGDGRRFNQARHRRVAGRVRCLPVSHRPVFVVEHYVVDIRGDTPRRLLVFYREPDPSTAVGTGGSGTSGE